MRAFALVILASAATACGSSRTAPASPEPAVPGPVHPIAAMRDADRRAARELWPGFEPLTIPVAIYDGENTYLFRHPAPPSEFTSLSAHRGVWAYEGRHPLVTANSTVQLADVRTATVLAPEPPVASRQFAALILHELFHAYQREHHPGWVANEVDLFTYPVEDAKLLSLRRLESEALRRGLAARNATVASCWTRSALEQRALRFADLGSGAQYERASELNEGLARYLEHHVLQQADSLALTTAEFAPEAVRDRAYATGASLAILLDRFAPAWKVALSTADTIPLDALLEATPAIRDAEPSACGFAPDERATIAERAAHDVGELHTRRAERRRSFLEAPGIRLIIVAEGAPLSPQGFDPLNVQRVAPNEVLHTRYLKLGSGRGQIEIIGRSALTVAAGAHPLFNGVRSVTLTGLATEPRVIETEGKLSVTGEGFEMELPASRLERDGETITIRLRAGD